MTANLKLLLYAYSTAIVAQGILSPIYAFFVLDLGGGIFEAATTVALFSIITGIVTILIYQTDWSYTYRKECLVWGWLLWTISLLMYCCMSSIFLLCVSQVLSALGNAFSTAAYDAEFSDASHPNLASGWAWFEGMTNIASGIAALFAGLLVGHFGLGFLMICVAIFATISFGIIYYYSYIKKQTW